MIRKLLALLPLVFVSFLHTLATNYYVSNLGNDSNNGRSPANSFLTLQKINSLNLQPGDTVFFRANDVFLGQLIIRHSGTSNLPVVFTTFGDGANATLSGAQMVNSWQKANNDISFASIDQQVFQLFFNDKLKPVARYPNHGFLTIDHGNKTSLTDQALEQLPFDLTGATLRIRAVAWQYEKNRIKEQHGATLTFETPMQYQASKGYGYFFDNKFEFIDREGEWYHDTISQKLYALLPANPKDINIYASTIDVGIVVASDVVHVSINGLNIEKYGLAGIKGEENSSFIHISNCFIGSCGVYGIQLETGTKNYTIEKNHIADIPGRGISTLESSYLTIQHNRIEKTGLIPGYGFDGVNNGIGIAILRNEKSFSVNHSILKGLYEKNWPQQVYDSLMTMVNLPFPDEKFMLEALETKIVVAGKSEIHNAIVAEVKKVFDNNDVRSEHNTIAYNQVDSSGYCGIRLDGTYSNASYNVVTNSILNMNDGGAIYCWAQHDDYTHHNIIRGNIVRHAIGNSEGTPANSVYANGIYVDNKCHNIRVEGNTVTNTTCGILINDESYQNHIVGNTTFDNQYGLVFSEYFMPGSLTNCTAKDNILYAKGYNQRALFIESRISESFAPVTLENNIYGSASYIFPVTTLTYSNGVRLYRDYSPKAWSDFYQWENNPVFAIPEKLENSLLLSEIVINPTAESVIIHLEDGTVYTDIHRNQIENQLPLLPFTSKIVIREP
jgi:parallel beta-helix repeat protein